MTLAADMHEKKMSRTIGSEGRELARGIAKMVKTRWRNRWRRLASCGVAFIGIVSFSVLGSHGQSEPEGSITESAQILALLRAKQYDAAHRATGQLLSTHPHDCALLSLDGLALNGMKQTAAAGEAFHKAVETCPNDLLALEGAAQSSYALKAPDTAELLERILVLRPDEVTSHAMLASVYRAQQNCSAALPHYKASQTLFVSSPKLQEGYAYCLMSSGDAEGAAANYRALLDTHPNDTIRYNLAFVLWKLHDAASAWQLLQPLLSTDGSEDVLELGAEVAEASGRTPDAVELLRNAIVKDPKNQENYLRFAQLSFAHNSYQVGIDMLNAGLTQLPEAGRLYLERGVLEVQLSQFDQAITDFEKAHHLDPELSLAIDALGILRSQQHKSDTSLKIFQQEAAERPTDSLLQYLYAEALSESSSESDALPKAIAAAEQSIKIEPGYQPAHDLLAVLYLRANNPERAAGEAQAAQALDPSDETAIYQELVARRRLGQASEVEHLVKQLAEVRKKNAERQRQGQGFVLKDETAP